MINGLLLVDKPKGWTSFDVVAKVRGVLCAAAKQQGLPSKIKIGHTGTLDPMATGLLVLAIGKYTKKVPELTKKDKVYEGTITLGATSTTDDAEGELTKVSTLKPNNEAVTAVLQSFLGDSMQTPPQFSAIKVGGVRSYMAARRGDSTKLEPRKVIIYSISDIKYEYPHISFIASVGSGTYIRSLARDVGEKLGTGGYLSDLRRISIDDYSIANAVSVNDITLDIIVNNIIEMQ